MVARRQRGPVLRAGICAYCDERAMWPSGHGEFTCRACGATTTAEEEEGRASQHKRAARWMRSIKFADEEE